MNYLAHLFLSQSTNLSLTGNLMGDFMKGVEQNSLPEGIIKGIENHRLVDKFTDSHDVVRALKQHLSPERKRFSGVISDVVFDHFLSLYWSRFSNIPLEQFINQSYDKLYSARVYMPTNMRNTVKRMSTENWLLRYQDIDVVGQALDGISRRIRFENSLQGSIDEVIENYDVYQASFLMFFPELCKHVTVSSVEG